MVLKDLAGYVPAMTKPIRPTRGLPPLNPLRAFEAAARHRSFTHAADELCVTQGAISRSVRTLEDFFGVPLFERTGNGLALNDKSEKLAASLTEVFGMLNDATSEFLGNKSSPILTVWCYTSFAIGYLIPHLPEFKLHHPQIKVRLASGTDSMEFSEDQIDVRIRYGRGHWKGYESTLLFKEELRPVCSPKLLDPKKRPYNVDILRALTLLHQDLRRNDWPEWLELAGAVNLRPHDNLMFDELSVAYQGAIAGLGVVIAQRAYFRRELETGQLFEPFDHVLHRDLGYYVTIPSERRVNPQAIAFRDWLVNTLQESLSAA
ncbi:Gcv operon activator [Terricaulis silvestris]|uniref:Gcv operon activator n=2 Tax=Terricaulis silvestris TaxID=2686094 RepID=A0A6I6MLT4_9CAUL|nr:Gcv operon activator [Terricaulis silvestris]